MARPINFLKVVAATITRDLKGLIILKRTDSAVNKLRKRNATVQQVFQENVAKYPNKVMLVNNEREWTFAELDEFSNKVAAYFSSKGFQPGDDVALFMRSCPEYIGVWLGLAKAGIVTALINTNQRLNPLAHSVTTVNAKAIIFDQGQLDAVSEVRPLLSNRDLKYFRLGLGDGELPDGITDMTNDLKSVPGVFDAVKANFTDRLLYIYTSGTTGLPKAAVIKHARYFTTGVGVHNIMRMRPDDIVYTCLPLYHFAGGIMGSSQAVLYGNTMAIRSKFSVTNYWTECIKYKATVGQYIGELCRYLYAQPEKEEDKKHSVRLMWGNGMRPNMYGDFGRRFAINDIVEVYGTSEGNAQVVNIDNREGSCGFVSVVLPNWLMNLVYPVALIKCDQVTGEPIRNKKGLCERCGPGETGHFVGRIEAKDPLRQFDGYSDKVASEKKIIRNVFFKGDSAYASGDLLTMDELGYLYFKDRTGDTFRWKGENVSTTEVESVVSKEAGLADCVVYSIEIPGCEGKAGMVSIEDPISTLNVNELLVKLKRSLPGYAVPVILRVVRKLETTATLKIPKNILQKEGFNINVIEDPMYVLDKQQTEYRRLDKTLYNELVAGKLTF